ncbi:nucleoporin complex subunit 54-domain-containing protein [Rhodofomes roseus]|uniref:Nucleoporin complex subunit 54-domain-containing protein n=1 Tax=Rhodofomes roseus TaxID=34475 RepID=A0ABQ8KBD7_9APHY|nr:nucleoporin complex subunit 54-domain-containing protein [Rhodofomes roseus]KAH9834748.1 nucleoporin complex subunit 54-domain-containing protein [Rhodofomes roseus]
MFSSFGNTQNPGQQPQQQGGAPAPSGGLFGSTNNASQPATGGTSLFGNNQQQNPPAGGNQQTGGTTGGGLFGGTNTQSGGGGGLFGNPNPSNTQQSGGGLFGGSNTQNTQPGGGLFGSTNTANTQQSGGGLFGNTSAQPTTGGFFGNQPAAGTSTGNPLFGNAGSSNTTGGGLFGNTTGGTNTTQPSGGLFGSTNTSSNTGGTGGGLFGNAGGTNTNTTGGGLFGNTSTNTSAPSGGLFGSTNTNTNTTNASGGLFGNANPAPATSGGLFGSTTTTPNPVPGLFGNQSQAGPSTNQLFGGSTLGQAPQQQRTGSLFGGSTLGGSLGATQGNLYSSRALVPAGQTQADAQSQFVSLQQRIESIYHAWNPASPQCRFQHYFYNLVDPSQVHLYGRPANATNDALWQKAVRENPDPSCLVPVIANGLDDLQKRVEAQTQQAAMHQEKLKELRTRIQALAQRHELSNASRLHRAAALQTQLTHRVLKVVQHLHLLIPAVRSSAIRPEEEALRTALEDIDQEIRRPGGTGRIRGKLNELWALVGAVTAARERDRKTGGVEWAVVDEEGLQQIAQILEQEQAGLAHLTKILQKDLRDLAVIQGTAVKEEEPDLLMSSTSTLRGSTVY